MTWKLTSANGDLTGNDCIAFNPAISLISFAYLGLIGFVVCMSGSPQLAILRNSHLVNLGTISYGLYVYHWIVYETTDTVIKFGLKMGDPLWLDAIKVALSIVVAILSWRFIERPLLRFKDHFTYKRVDLVDQARSQSTPCKDCLQT